MEQRAAEERDRSNKKVAAVQDELEQRLRDEALERDEEIECLQNELREAEQRHQQYVTQVEHELSLKHQLCEALERQLREAASRSELIEAGRNSAFEK